MIKDKNINVGLLMKLVSIQSKSFKDEEMQKFLKETLGTMKLEYEEDSYGNIYITKGKAKSYPCVVAHTDTVHEIIEQKNFKVFKVNSNIYAMDALNGRQVGTGGDDKCGLFVALHALKHHKNLKVVFYRNEEVGCLGSNHSIKNKKEFYKDCNFVLQCDRKGNEDFITKSGGHDICSKEFIKDCTPFLKEYDFKTATGISTDVDKLVYEGIGISCVNISSGYWRPHTSTEVIDINDLKNVTNLVDTIITKLGNKKFKFVYTKPVYNTRTYNTRTYNSSRFNITKRLSTFEARYKRLIIKDSNLLDLVTPRTYSYITPVSELMFAPKDITLPISLGKDAKCNEKSKLRHNIVYLMEEDIFYCLRCQHPVTDIKQISKFRKEMTIKDRGYTFVYDAFNTIWLKKEEAVWKELQATYLAKSVENKWTTK